MKDKAFRFSAGGPAPGSPAGALAALTTGGFDVWLERFDIRVGVLLGKELLKAHRGSRAVVLNLVGGGEDSAWVEQRDSRCLSS